MNSQLLPVVHDDIGKVLEAEMLQEEYAVEVLRRLGEENPCVANFISSFALTTKDPTSVLYCGTLVYRLLESQAEADKLKEAICPSASGHSGIFSNAKRFIRKLLPR